MYLWLLLNRDESELTNRVYETQIISNSVGDWVRLVQSDKSELDINLTDEEIQCVSQNMFKNYVVKKVKISHLKYIAILKKKHSKARFLNCTEVQD